MQNYFCSHARPKRHLLNLIKYLKETSEDKNQSIYFVRVALKSDDKTCDIKIIHSFEIKISFE